MNKQQWILYAALAAAVILMGVLIFCWFGGDPVIPSETSGNTTLDAAQQPSETQNAAGASGDSTYGTDSTEPALTIAFGVTEKEENWDETSVKNTQQETQQQSQPTQGTESVQTQPQDTTVSVDLREEMTYEKYEFVLSAEEQYAFSQSFSSQKEFVKWYNAARAAYEATQNDYTLDPDNPNVDYGDLNGN